MVTVLDLSRKEVVQAIRDGKAAICVVGLGYVGLPLAVLFASEGAKVVGCVRTQRSAQKINRGETKVVEHDISPLLKEGAVMLESPCPNCGVRLFKLKGETFCPSCGKVASITKFGVHLKDAVATDHEKIVKSRQSLENLLKEFVETGKLYATTQTVAAVQQSDVILITVGTPVNEKNVPVYTDLENATRAVGKGLQKSSLVILKSTVSPGTTENRVKPILERESGLKAGKDFGVAFMPETIKEGHALHEFRTLPRIVGGISKRCAEAAANVFSIFPAPIHIYETPSIAEAAKLFQNIYRDVNLALVNELALACEKLGIDVTRVINAANIDPKTHLLTPGLIGGYCLPKDTYHLSRPSKMAGYDAKLITLARDLNNGMPSHVLMLVDEAFEEMNTPIKDSRIAVLGLGFKANSGDLRNTSAKPIVEGLLARGAVLIAQDPFARFDEVNKLLPRLQCTRSIQEAVRGATCTVIVTDHLEYRKLTADHLKKLMSTPSAVIDARNVINPQDATASGLVFRGLGKPRPTT